MEVERRLLVEDEKRAAALAYAGRPISDPAGRGAGGAGVPSSPGDKETLRRELEAELRDEWSRDVDQKVEKEVQQREAAAEAARKQRDQEEEVERRQAWGARRPKPAASQADPMKSLWEAARDGDTSRVRDLIITGANTPTVPTLQLSQHSNCANTPTEPTLQLLQHSNCANTRTVPTLQLSQHSNATDALSSIVVLSVAHAVSRRCEREILGLDRLLAFVRCRGGWARRLSPRANARWEPAGHAK